jgi:hypothetical protein
VNNKVNTVASAVGSEFVSESSVVVASGNDSSSSQSRLKEADCDLDDTSEQGKVSLVVLSAVVRRDRLLADLDGAEMGFPEVTVFGIV